MAPPGWYDDGTVGMERYWDGQAWTSDFAPTGSSVDVGHVATRGDWIGGVLLSVIMPVIGLVAGLVYVVKGGERAKCGWMCVGLSAVMGLVYVLAVAAGADTQGPVAP